MSIVFVKMKFQYLKHSLQKRMVYHSNQHLEAITKLWQRGYPYSRIVNIIIDSAIAQISKSTVAYQVKKFQETKSVETMRTASICEDAWFAKINKKPKLSEIKRNCNENWLVRPVWTNQTWTELLKRTLFFFERSDIKIGSL